MTTLIFDGANPFPSLTGPASGEPAGQINGYRVYQEGVAQALLEFGSFDTCHFLSRDPFRVVPPALQEAVRRHSPRARLLTTAELPTLLARPNVVVFAPGSGLTALMPLHLPGGGRRWPAIGAVHSLDTDVVANLALALLHAPVDQGDALLCSSRAARTVLERLWAGHGAEAPISLPVVPLGVRCDDFVIDRGRARQRLELAAEAEIVLYLGRLSPLSKCDLMPLVQLFAREVAPPRPRARLVLAGSDGPEASAGPLQAAARALGCADRIQVLPDIDHDTKLDLLAAADVFVSPSDHLQETFGISIIEAMAAGLPVVCSDWSGYRELLEDGVTGMLVPSYWLPLGPELEMLSRGSLVARSVALAAATIIDPGVLVARLGQLLDAPALRRTMGAAAQAEARRRFDWPVVIAAMEEVWHDLLPRAAGRAVASVGAPPPGGQRVFGHYPTRMLDLAVVATLTPAGRAYLDGALAAGPGTLADPRRVRQLLTLTGQHGPVALAKLVELARSSAPSTFVTLSEISAAAKYGLLSLTST